MGQANQRYAAKAKELAIWFCSDHPLRRNIDPLTVKHMFLDLLERGILVIEPVQEKPTC